MKKLTIFLTVFCLVFTIIALSVTYVSIKNSKAPQSAPITPPDLYGTYDNNDLAIDELKENIGGTEVTIPQIKGLKNEEIQSAVNMELKDGMYNLVASLPKCDYTYYNVSANFANVLSISFNASYYADDSYGSNTAAFNYNLVTGERLSFEDLFIDEDKILDLVRRSFYLDLSRMGEYDSDTNVFSPDENEVFKAVKTFMSSDNKTFSFSPSELNFYNVSNYIISADLIDYADNIAIYSRFLTDESIFTGEYPGHKNIFTFANSDYRYFDKIEYGLWEDNLWVDFATANSYQIKTPDPAYIAFKDRMYSELYENLAAYRTMAKENPDKFYILLAKPYVSQYIQSEYIDGEWQETPSYIASVNFNSNIVEMPIEIYNSTYRDKIIEGYRYRYFTMAGGLSIYPEEGDGAILYADDYRADTYNYKTGEKLTALTDVFHEDSDYMSVIEERTKDYLYQDNIYSTQSYLDEAIYTLSGDGILVSIPSLPDFEAYIHFGHFEKDSFKLLCEEDLT